MAFQYAICSEIFQGWELKRICAAVGPMGYTGLEIAPFTLGESVDEFSPEDRAEMRRAIEGEGMVCSGIHWLLVSPKGMHLTTRDDSIREPSWAYLGKLIDFCGDLGGPVMILGSPFQRDAKDGVTTREAMDRLIEGLGRLAPRAEERGVRLLMEAVSSHETNVVTTMAEASEIVAGVNHPSVQTMFDFHNASDEGKPLLGLLEEHYEAVRHVHVNEADGRHPGTGPIDFTPELQLLKERGYEGWISLEVFDFEAGSETIARESIEYLKNIEAGLQ